MNANNECRNYIVQSIVLCSILTICGLLAMKLGDFELTAPMIVSGCFILVIDIASAFSFRWVASKHSDMLPTFFTGVSGFRFLVALLVIAAWYIVADKSSMEQFIVVFIIYYMASLIHHAIFFSKISNRL